MKTPITSAWALWQWKAHSNLMIPCTGMCRSSQGEAMRPAVFFFPILCILGLKPIACMSQGHVQKGEVPIPLFP